VGRFSFGHFSQTPRAVPRCRILHGLGASFPAFRTKISFALQAGFGPIAFAGAWDVLRHGVLRPPDQHAGQNHSRDRQQRGPEHEPDQAPPRRPVVDPVVGGSLRVRDPAPPSRCFQSQSVPNSPPHARSGREAFPERRDSKADADHGLTLQSRCVRRLIPSPARLLTAVENGGAGRSKMVALGGVDLP